jgi:hypothetical protein
MIEWRDVERKAMAILETLEQLRDLGVRGPLGIPLDYPIEKMEEKLEHIGKRYGKPEAWERDLKSTARMAYDLAKAYAEETILKSKMKEWNTNCLTSCAYDTKKQVMACIMRNIEFKKIGEFEVPCTREEFEYTPEVCNIKTLEESAKRGCAVLTRGVPILGGANVIGNPRTGEIINLTAEAESYLTKLKERLQIE